MNIIYSYSNCSDKKYKQLFGANEGFVLRADQKYHSLLIKGFAENGISVRCLSGLPINRQAKRKFFINEPDEIENNIIYHYYKTLNLPIFRQIMVFFAGFLNVLFGKMKDAYLICDYQNVANAYGTMLAAKIKKIPTIVIVMDLPDFFSDNKTVQRIYGGTFGLADGFILLTEQMNEIVNKKDKPYIIIEGIADDSVSQQKGLKRLADTTGKNIIVYAGSLAKIYGIENLVKGLLKAKLDNSELWIYGNGDYREELMKICLKHNNIVYKGVCSNEEIVEIEMKASLLVNPRPTAPEYTKYSFPSKTIEYMASGAPVLTTRLPGVPKEYFDYVYTFEKEDPDGICEALRKVFLFSKDDRAKKGLSAAEFVLSKKSNSIQSKKVINFIEERLKNDKE